MAEKSALANEIVFAQRVTLGLESDGTEELMVPGSDIISNGQEHSPQHQVNDRWNHVLEVVAICPHETLSFVLSVRTLEALHRQHNKFVFF